MLDNVVEFNRGFEFYAFSWVRRDANRVAYVLLLLLIGLVSVVISFPPLILRELRKDVCGLFV